jgi:serine/threonine-protein kinase
MAEIRVGEFVLDSKLGKGGMGIVYRARQITLERWVAVKFLMGAGGERSVERFYREARSAAQLVHPNVVQIYTFGEYETTPYYAMEYVEGKELAGFAGGGRRLEIDETVEVIRGVAKALAAATACGIVHRDIKPSNIMLAKSGLVKVMDFGLAKAGAQNETVTLQGQIVGTPVYMSPEQALGKNLDVRADLYSLGCVMFECLTGEPPFQADNATAIIYQHCHAAPRRPSQMNPACPPAMEDLCLKLLAKSPAERCRTPEELLEALAAHPGNAAVAEASLARRVQQALRTGPPQGSRVLVPPSFLRTPATTPAPTLSPAPSVSPARKTAVRLPAATLVTPPADAEIAAPAVTPPPAAPPRPSLTPPPAELPAAAPARRETPSGAKTANVRFDDFASSHAMPPPAATPAASPASAPVSPRASATLTAAAAQRRPKGVDRHFRRLPDGRWSYEASQGHCVFAEGLAAEELPGFDLQVGALGDCLLCNKWTTRQGCAEAAGQQVAQHSAARGVELLEEIAFIWCAAGRFDVAITRVEDYVKAHPEEAAGYRALARIYDHPGYKGKDRYRALVLYNRFLELAEKSGGFKPVALDQVRKCLEALKSQPARPSAAEGQAEWLHTFTCACTAGSEAYYAFGALSRQELRLARLGRMDPESGVRMGDPGLVKRATLLMRRMTGSKAEEEERRSVRAEAERLGESPSAILSRAGGDVLGVPLTAVQECVCETPSEKKGRVVRLRTADLKLAFDFPEGKSFEAERAALIIRRLTGK